MLEDLVMKGIRTVFSRHGELMAIIRTQISAAPEQEQDMPYGITMTAQVPTIPMRMSFCYAPPTLRLDITSIHMHKESLRE